MSREEAILSAYERLVEAFADDLLGMPDGEALASHTPAAARVAADGLRRRLHRDAPDSSAEASRGPSRGRAQEPLHRPERKS